MTTPDWMIVGRVRKPHGVAGEVVIEPITDAPDKVFAVGRRVFAGTTSGDPSPDGEELVISRVRPFTGGRLLVRFETILHREGADRWRDRYLLLPSAELEPLRTGEVYVHELVGMRVELASGHPIGAVVDVYDLPQGLGLDVSHRAGRVILPYLDQYVREVDRAGRRIVVELPEGMLE